ncbi:MAG: Do family serine endopeptidase [Candidatus Omnitrophota bacterium]|nr:MAG: Do family serine endopeptidase [Candidatus Omnitrophota bacterium]
MRKGVFYLIVLAITLALIVGIVVYNKSDISRGILSGIKKECRPAVTSVAKGYGEGRTIKVRGEFDIQNAFIKVADEAGKAVVAISTERTHKVGFRRPTFRFRRFGSPFGENGEDPFEKFFEDFFGESPEREFKQQGLGSGFIIDKEGHILTNHHVVEGADKINITLPDGRSFAGTVKGADPRSDLAVVKIKAKNLPAVQLGDSNVVQVGEWVVALGNPFGHVLKSPKPTVTVGVISALHRQLRAPGGERGYLDMIQTDAAINPGNSGGPLCDLSGRVIGINVVIFSTSGGYQGVGFAIPINDAKGILGDLIKGKEISYGWLGVSVQEITPDIAEYFNLPDKKGALISEILPDGPAEKDGLKEGDIIKTFDGKEIATVHNLLREVSNKKIGEIAAVGIIRDRVKMTVKVKIGKRPSRIELAEEKAFEVPEKIKKWRGIKVTGITDEIARELNLEDKEGVVIIELDASGPGYAAGLRKGDVLKEINKTKIRNLADYKKITEEAKGLALVRTTRGYYTIKENEKE